MGMIKNRLKEIKRLFKEEEEICAEIRALSKERPLMVVKDTWSKPSTQSGFNYKGRACQIQDIYIQRGQVWIKPKLLDMRTKRFTIEVLNYYREDHFREITSYKDIMDIKVPLGVN